MSMGYVLTMLKLCTVICFIIFQWTSSVILDGLQGITIQRHERPGFISIDCGSNTSYTEESTTLNYTTDADYIDTGVNFDVSEKYKSSGLTPLLYTVRSFPEGNKNCYTLRQAQGRDTKYLIRTYFMYGNYDQLNKPPTFDLHLGVDVWLTIQLDNSSHILVKEIIHTLKMDYLYVCLANTGLGTPFISGLELRPLIDSIYKTDFGSLNLCYRYHTSNQPYVIRYNDDVFDRIWQSANWPNVSITQSHSEIASHKDAFLLPSSVMKAAIMPENVDQPIQLIMNVDHEITEYYCLLHVTEFLMLQTGEVREYNIAINHGPFYGPYKPSYLEADTIYSTKPFISGSFVNITIKRNNRSTLPPLISAVELYSLKRFSQLSTNEADVLAITNTKSFYKKMKNWQGDPCMPEPYSWPGVGCSYNTSESSRIISLNLSSKGLTGYIAASFADLTSLQSLDLSNNNLTGQIPEFLADLPLLKTLNLSGNSITGSVPELLLEKTAAGSLSLSVENNPGLCPSTSCTSKKQKKVPVALFAVIASIVILVAGFNICCMYKMKSRRSHGSLAAGHPSNSVNSKGKGVFTRFTYSELTSITRGFQSELGKGGSAVVYYGCLNDGLEVAVKMLSATVHGSEQFSAEVELLMAIRHKNLVSLVGYCKEGSNLALVYEFMAAGNLHNLLLATTSLSWKKRLKIAVDIAQGLDYLHNGCRPPIVHRDVKTQNILLNETLQAKVADFGLSKIFPDGSNSHVLTRVIGTPGYLDPEYYKTHQLNEKSDVYSYGVVLLELITGKAAILKNRERTSVLSLVQWVISVLDKGDISHILDERLQEVENLNSVWRITDIAMSCVKPTAVERPTMSQIVADLKECLARVTGNVARAPNDTLEMSLASVSTDMVPSVR
ncbi:probable LRR receptor-like serine/threonine-protein kinase At4g29180 isoform X2 [Amaranthus tricolor]|uniref:probable LRR receptor-like serine/threonine-protein kinase At4g29180 isoform X2 n=1 Tax=Amaranthus tricolor TaxID=29722 RepID=UPI002587B99D|nr:probable LRR receptor-like serine/threonine-protein kinase At4g29180 isoform X2 [Amaranthus tricolor]